MVHGNAIVSDSKQYTNNTTKLLSLVWFFRFAAGYTYFGLIFGVNILYGNLYLNMFLINVVDVPLMAFSGVLVDWWGIQYTHINYVHALYKYCSVCLNLLRWLNVFLVHFCAELNRIFRVRKNTFADVDCSIVEAACGDLCMCVRYACMPWIKVFLNNFAHTSASVRRCFKCMNQARSSYVKIKSQMTTIRLV